MPIPTPGHKPSYGAAPAPEHGTNLYDATIYDSHVERHFAQWLENNHEHVNLFTRLPRRFRIRTPVGEYSPDWAILYDESGTLRLYLVRETKDTLNLDDLHWDEAMLGFLLLFPLVANISTAQMRWSFPPDTQIGNVVVVGMTHATAQEALDERIIALRNQPTHFTIEDHNGEGAGHRQSSLVCLFLGAKVTHCHSPENC